MELNTKGRYAVMAMADLAKHAGDASVPLSAIAERQRLSLDYLEQIFLKLRRAGRGGEHARSPWRLPTWPRAGGHQRRRCDVGGRGRYTHDAAAPAAKPGALGHERCLTHDLWTALGDQIELFLSGVSLKDVLDGVPTGQEPSRKDRVSRHERGSGNRGDARVVIAKRTYLDFNASAPLRPEAREAMLAALDLDGNASSVHAEGRRARAIVDEAREAVAALVNADPSEVVFTSGATEANAWALSAPWRQIAMSGIEHDSVRAPASHLVETREASTIDLAVSGSDGTVGLQSRSPRSWSASSCFSSPTTKRACCRMWRPPAA